MTARPPRDSGAALVFALLFITAIGLITGSLLGYTSATISAGARLDERATADTDVGGALALAVNDVRRSTYDFGSGTDQNCLASGGATGSGGELEPLPGAEQHQQLRAERDHRAGRRHLCPRTGHRRRFG